MSTKNEEFCYILKTVLDTSGIGNTDIPNLQKILDKYTVNVPADLNQEQLIRSVKQVLPQVVKEINKLSGTDIKIDIDDSLIEQSMKQILQDRKQFEKSLNATSFDKFNSKVRQLGASIKAQFKEVGESISKSISLSSAFCFMVAKAKEAVSELKEVNTLLTDISKTNDNLTKADLKKIQKNAFQVASKYGKEVTDYLSDVQKASRAGYKNPMEIAELSIAVQDAGNMTAELANQYIAATNQAYELGGSIEKLTEILDGSNNITNRNAINMSELAEGMSAISNEAAALGVKVNETTAALGTMITTTQQSGSEAASAFETILHNIRQISNAEEGIDAESLGKYEEACEALNVSLKETKNGVISLRDPMEVIKDLAKEYSKLDPSDARRTNLLSSVGGELEGNALNALLENYDLYEKMLDEYAKGTGSISVEVEKTAKSWEGSLNRLSNTWTDTIGNIANSDAIISMINSLNGLLSVINKMTEVLGPLKTIGLGAGLFASLKNVGSLKMFRLKPSVKCCSICRQ